MADSTTGTRDPGARIGLSHLSTMTAYWLGLNVLWGAMTTIILPRIVEQLVPPAVKTTAIAVIAAATAILAIIVQPLAGSASDRLTSRFGKRRPLMIVGVIAQVLLLIALVRAGSYIAVVLVMLATEVFSNTAQGSYQGLMPDLVPQGQRGLASGLLGAASLSGSIFGVAVAGWAIASGDTTLAILFAGGSLALGTIVTLVGSRERASGRGWIGLAPSPAHVASGAGPLGSIGLLRQVVRDTWSRDVLDQRDYLWVLASRLAILTAAGSLQPFVYYLLEDSFHLGERTAEAVTPLAAIVAFVALFAAIPGGMLTARFGRVKTIMLSGISGAIGAAAFAVAPTYESLFIVAIPFGMALGIFLSADWALMADLAPKGEEGKYLGLSNTVTSGANLLAVIIGGPIADAVNRIDYGLGFRAVFVVAAIEFAIGAWAMRRVHEPKPGPEPGEGRGPEPGDGTPEAGILPG